MTIQEAIHVLFRMCEATEVHWSALTLEEKVGFMFADRWAPYSKIPACYNHAEVLSEIRKYIKTRAEMVIDERIEP